MTNLKHQCNYLNIIPKTNFPFQKRVNLLKKAFLMSWTNPSDWIKQQVVIGQSDQHMTHVSRDPIYEYYKTKQRTIEGLMLLQELKMMKKNAATLPSN